MIRTNKLIKYDYFACNLKQFPILLSISIVGNDKLVIEARNVKNGKLIVAQAFEGRAAVNLKYRSLQKLVTTVLNIIRNREPTIYRKIISGQKLTKSEALRLLPILSGIVSAFAKKAKNSKNALIASYSTSTLTTGSNSKILLLTETKLDDDNDLGSSLDKQEDLNKQAKRIVTGIYIMGGALILMAVLLLITFMLTIGRIMVKKALYAAVEAEVGSVIRKLDKTLFKGQTKYQKEFIKHYATLINAIDTLLQSDKMNGLLVYGPPGTGKSYVVKRQLYFNNLKEGRDYVIIKGAMEIADLVTLYGLLFKYRKKLIVFDDFDIQWTPEVIGLFKAATDSYPERIVSLPKVARTEQSEVLPSVSLPDEFVFKGKIIILTNFDKDKIPMPLISRMSPVHVAFPIKQMLELIYDMLKFIEPSLSIEEKEKVYNQLLALYKQGKLKYLDLRIFEMALQFYKQYGDKWLNYFQEILEMANKLAQSASQRGGLD